MRFVVAQPGPSFSVQDVFAGWCEALRELGVDVVEYNLDSRLTFYSAALLPTDEDGKFRQALSPEAAKHLAVNGLFSTLYQTRPDVLLVVSGFYLPAEVYTLARAYGTRVVLLHTESPYEDQRQAELAELADINLINDPQNLDRFPNRTVYMPHAYRPTVHCPGPVVPELVCDLAFVGTGYPSRVAFFEAMDLSGRDVLLAGPWLTTTEDSLLRRFLGHELDQCLDNADAVPIYRSAKAGINLYRREAQRPELSQGWAMGPREVEMAASGLFFLRDPRGEGDEVLDMLPTFVSPEDASAQLHWWLDHEDERAAVARKAREAIADRTFANHAAQLLRLLDA